MKQEVVGTYDRAAHLYDQVGTRRFTYYSSSQNSLFDALPLMLG